jgi:hypothetical protein
MHEGADPVGREPRRSSCPGEEGRGPDGTSPGPGAPDPWGDPRVDSAIPAWRGRPDSSCGSAAPCVRGVVRNGCRLRGGGGRGSGPSRGFDCFARGPSVSGLDWSPFRSGPPGSGCPAVPCRFPAAPDSCPSRRGAVERSRGRSGEGLALGLARGARGHPVRGPGWSCEPRGQGVCARGSAP